jgi:hypothetical protein
MSKTKVGLKVESNLVSKLDNAIKQVYEKYGDKITLNSQYEKGIKFAIEQLKKQYPKIEV